MNKPESFLKALLLKEYEDRLNTFYLLNETKVHDKHGNVVLEPDLKVRHKKSGFEYTIKNVKKDGNDLLVVLRTPDSPRFSDVVSTNKVIAGQEPEAEKLDRETLPGEEVISVKRDEFEKEYEVDWWLI